MRSPVEVELRAKIIGWKGKADLLVLADAACEITDFKTGTADEAPRGRYAALSARRCRIAAG